MCGAERHGKSVILQPNPTPFITRVYCIMLSALPSKHLNLLRSPFSGFVPGSAAERLILQPLLPSSLVCAVCLVLDWYIYTKCLLHSLHYRLRPWLGRRAAHLAARRGLLHGRTWLHRAAGTQVRTPQRELLHITVWQKWGVVSSAICDSHM